VLLVRRAPPYPNLGQKHRCPDSGTKEICLQTDYTNTSIPSHPDSWDWKQWQARRCFSVQFCASRHSQGNTLCILTAIPFLPIFNLTSFRQKLAKDEDTHPLQASQNHCCNQTNWLRSKALLQYRSLTARVHIRYGDKKPYNTPSKKPHPSLKQNPIQFSALN